MAVKTQQRRTLTEQLLRPWSSLGEDEQIALMIAYQPELDAQQPTCDFATKLVRMQRWLAERSIAISEADMRRPSRQGPER